MPKELRKRKRRGLDLPYKRPKTSTPKVLDLTKSSPIQSDKKDLKSSDTSSSELGPTLDTFAGSSSSSDDLVNASEFDARSLPSDLLDAMIEKEELRPQNFSHYQFFVSKENGLEAKRPKGSESPKLHFHDHGEDACGFNLTSLHQWGSNDDKMTKRLNDFSMSKTKPKGATYSGDREYPMGEYKGFDRGHGIDHADGNKDSTTSEYNFTPQEPNYNRGLRNHVVDGMRTVGGGYYSEQNDYGDSEKTTHDGKLVPKEITFNVAPTPSDKDSDSQHAQFRQWIVPQLGKGILQGETIELGNPFLKKQGKSTVEPGTYPFKTKEQLSEYQPSDKELKELGAINPSTRSMRARKKTSYKYDDSDSEDE